MNRREIKQSEGEFLEAQQMEARAALRRTFSELKGACADAANPRYLIEQHPVVSAGIVVTAVGTLGFLIHKLRRKTKTPAPTVILHSTTPSISVELEEKKKVSKGKAVVVLAALGKWAGPLVLKTLVAQRFGRMSSADDHEDEEAKITFGGSSNP